MPLLVMHSRYRHIRRHDLTPKHRGHRHFERGPETFPASAAGSVDRGQDSWSALREIERGKRAVQFSVTLRLKNGSLTALSFAGPKDDFDPEDMNRFLSGLVPNLPIRVDWSPADSVLSGHDERGG